MKCFCVSICSVILLLACSAGCRNIDPKSALMEVHEQYVDSILSEDYDGYAASLSPDVKDFPGSEEAFNEWLGSDDGRALNEFLRTAKIVKVSCLSSSAEIRMSSLAGLSYRGSPELVLTYAETKDGWRLSKTGSPKTP